MKSLRVPLFLGMFAAGLLAGCFNTDYLFGTQCESDDQCGSFGCDAGVNAVPGETRYCGGALGFPVRVAAGASHSCALLRDGGVSCWGGVDSAVAGDTPQEGSLRGVQTLGELAVDVVAGGSHSCMLSSAGQLVCWGADDRGQLGDGLFNDDGYQGSTRTQAPGATEHVDAGRAHVCAAYDGELTCWGDNTFGQLGDGLVQGPLPPGVEDDTWEEFPCDELTPCRVSSAQPVVGLTFDVDRVATGTDHTCALGHPIFIEDEESGVLERAEQAFLACWGNNSRFQLGVSTPEYHGVGTLVFLESEEDDEEEDAIAIAAGAEHTCMLSAAARGVPYEAESGVDPETDLFGPFGPHPSLVDDFELTVSCWGAGGAGQLGDGLNEDRPLPVQVPGLDDVVQIVAGAAHTCALRSTGAVLCWGENGSGQLGDGTTTDRASPVAVTGLGAATHIAAGDAHTCAVVDRESVWCWGAGGDGQLGNGGTQSSSVPVEVDGLPVIPAAPVE